MKKCVIQQGAGLGDIFFSQKVAHWYRGLGYEIVWPIADSIMWLKDYIPGVTWVDYWQYRNSHPNFMDYGVTKDAEGNLNVNLGDSHHSHGGRIMTSKITMCGLEWGDWANYFIFNRNHEKEQQLYNLFGLSEDEEYVLQSCTYSTPPDVKEHHFRLDTDKPIIKLQIINPFTLIDWCKIIENASEIWVVDSAINYLMEVLPLRSKKTVVLAARNKSEIDYLFTKQDDMIQV